MHMRQQLAIGHAVWTTYMHCVQQINTLYGLHAWGRHSYNCAAFLHSAVRQLLMACTPACKDGGGGLWLRHDPQTRAGGWCSVHGPDACFLTHLVCSKLRLDLPDDGLLLLAGEVLCCLEDSAVQVQGAP